MMDTARTPSLVISDLQTGLAYLGRIPLSDPMIARQQLERLLDGLLAAPPTTAILFLLLERMRAPLSKLVDELARAYQSEPLPFSTDSEQLFQQVVALLSKMGQAYAHCELPDSAPIRTDDARQFATILHRRICYAGLVIIEHFRAHRELPQGRWLELHRLFDLAELLGVAYTPLDDSTVSTLQATHCAAAYAAILLIDIAGPYSQSVRNLTLIRRWAVLWSPLVSFHRLDDDLALPPYIVELGKDASLHPSAISDEIGDDARRLDTARLGLQIDHMLGQLRQRMTPSQLGLGEETSGHVLRLLGYLSRPWTQSALQRRFRRFATDGVARVAQGFEAMYFYVEGREFDQADAATVYSRGEFDQLFTFRERSDPGVSLNIKPHISFPLDEWSVINHSANGFRLARSCAGQRLGPGELLAVCPHDGESFLLAQVTWLMQEHQGGLIAGLALLPGVPTGVGVRRSHGVMTSSERFTPAFLLPAVPAIGEGSSLVLPSVLYQASHVLDVSSGDGIWQLRMNHVLQSGPDFLRISYELL